MADKPIKVLFVDDDPGFAKTFKRDASGKRVIIEHFKTAEEAKQRLVEVSEKHYGGIVLDVKGLGSKDDSIPDPAYFDEARQTLTGLAPCLPIYGITGETDSREDWKKLFGRTIDIFSKEPDEIDKLLEKLKANANDLDHITIMKKYQTTFTVIEDYFSISEEKRLISVLLNMDKGDGEIEKNLAQLRNLIESVLIRLNKHDPAIVPSDLIGAEVKFRPIMRSMKENGFFTRDDYINKLLDACYTCQSNFGSHQPRNINFGILQKNPGIMAVRANTFAVMELIEWCGEIVGDSQQ